MSEFLRLTIDGPDGRLAAGQVRASMSKLRSEFLPSVMHAAGEYLRRVVLRRQFESHGAYLGAGWKGLGARYLAWKAEHGYPADVGQRTGALLQALTGEPQPFSLTGLSYPSSQPTQIRAVPILEWDADHVTIGADVTEDGEEYPGKFSDTRPIFGGGQLPPEVEFGIGKLLALAVGASTHSDEMTPEMAAETVEPAMLHWIGVQAVRRAAGAA